MSKGHGAAWPFRSVGFLKRREWVPPDPGQPVLEVGDLRKPLLFEV